MPGSGLVDDIAALLRTPILAGEYQPGERLPSERQLSEKMGVSRGVIREALERLAGQGLVRTRRGDGSRVESPSGRTISKGLGDLLRRTDHGLLDLTIVRLPLESAAAGLAALHREEEHLRRMEQTQKVFASPRRSREAKIQADLDFHVLLAEASGNPIFLLILEPIQELLAESRRLTLSIPGGCQHTWEQHGRILEAIHRRDPEEAFRAMHRHMESALRALAHHYGREVSIATPSPSLWR